MRLNAAVPRRPRPVSVTNWPHTSLDGGPLAPQFVAKPAFGTRG
jgi:hypothetical protein